MVALNPPSSRSVVQVPEGLVDRYEAAGWTKVEQPKPRRKRAKADDENDEK